MCKWGENQTVELIQPACIAAEGSDTRKAVLVDRCIAGIVQALNSAGIRTLGSCCGHGKSSGEILLEDGRRIIVEESQSGAMQS